LLEAYNSFDHAKSKSPIIKPQTKSKQQATSGDWWVKGIGFILLIALMVLMAQSGINYFNNHSAGQLPVQEDNDNANINGEVVNNNTALVVGEPRENGEAAVYTPPTEEEAAVANNNSEEETSESQETPTSTTTAVETTTVAETTATSESTTTTEAETTTAEIEADKVDLRKMLLHYSKASWTRVTDKTNKSVYEGIPKDGDVITVQGEPPFKVRLGVLSHVMIEYNNKKISADEYPERSGRNVIVGEALSQENASH
jgi:cytoskeleton protein RodZ